MLKIGIAPKHVQARWSNLGGRVVIEPIILCSQVLALNPSFGLPNRGVDLVYPGFRGPPTQSGLEAKSRAGLVRPPQNQSCLR